MVAYRTRPGFRDRKTNNILGDIEFLCRVMKHDLDSPAVFGEPMNPAVSCGEPQIVFDIESLPEFRVRVADMRDTDQTL